jgi:hypothetical protein
MTLDIFKEKGTPLDKQQFTWRELVQTPSSKLDDDAFTRVRIILMNGLESEALRFSHATARMMNGAFRLPLAQVRRVEQHQQTMASRSIATRNHHWLRTGGDRSHCERSASRT